MTVFMSVGCESFINYAIIHYGVTWCKGVLCLNLNMMWPMTRSRSHCHTCHDVMCHGNLLWLLSSNCQTQYIFIIHFGGNTNRIKSAVYETLFVILWVWVVEGTLFNIFLLCLSYQYCFHQTQNLIKCEMDIVEHKTVLKRLSRRKEMITQLLKSLQIEQ